MVRRFCKKIFLKDDDILHSLNFNIFLKSREVILQEDKIIYFDYRKFNYKEELNNYYQKKDKKIYMYISKSDKIMQLLNNIFLYLSLPKEKLLFKIEKNTIYINIYKLIKLYKIKKNFNVISFFKYFDWIKNVEKIEEDILKIDLADNEYLKYEYDILQEKFCVIMASKKDNEFVIINPIDKIIKIGIKLSYY